jgi:D-serine deaminase-like pyridoxal phosphate-dependent protein
LTLHLPAIARPGDTLAAVGTPALMIDLDAFEANLQHMAEWAARHALALRPHAKAHKSSTIALRQIAAGAVGVCCQKLSEAYPFAAAGVASIHISNEFVGADKVAMAVQLAAHVQLSVCVDTAAQVEALGAAAGRAGVHVAVLPEVDVGQGRCGVTDSTALLRLIDAIAAWPALRFAGLQAYQGGAQHLAEWAQRREAAGRAADATAVYLLALEAHGIACTVVTGGGTGTVEFDAASGVYTELQPGSYLFMDEHYGANQWLGELQPQRSLYVAATVMSAARPGVAICDAGLKSLAVDSGLPRHVLDMNERSPTAWRYMAANDEHGVLHASGARPDEHSASPLGQRLLLVPGHCDPTANLYDEYVCFRGTGEHARVEALWPIDARGLSR